MKTKPDPEQRLRRLILRKTERRSPLQLLAEQWQNNPQLQRDAKAIAAATGQSCRGPRARLLLPSDALPPLP